MAATWKGRRLVVVACRCAHPWYCNSPRANNSNSSPNHNRPYTIHRIQRTSKSHRRRPWPWDPKHCQCKKEVAWQEWDKCMAIQWERMDRFAKAVATWLVSDVFQWWHKVRCSSISRTQWLLLSKINWTNCKNIKTSKTLAVTKWAQMAQILLDLTRTRTCRKR